MNAERSATRVALVSGASREIGRAIALELARRGAAVAAGFLEREEGAAETVHLIEAAGGRAFAVRLDVRDPASCRAAADGVREHAGSLDILVNNAAVTEEAPALAMDDEAWARVIDVSLTGAFRLSRACAKHMVLGRWGRIVNVSSIVASAGGRGQAGYVAAKAGLEGLTRALAIELAPRGILVNAVAPGALDAGMSRGVLERHRERILENILLGRPGEPREAAAVVGFLASEEASYITGQVIRVDGGWGMRP
jgi:3-oxoacyl-[acyl-carrier protein] reductase